MGIKVVLDKPLVDATDLDVKQLMMAVALHGVVCIPAAHLEPVALKEFADRWGETLQLPPGLAFNAQIPGLPEVARVGNIKPDGTILANHSAAEYWHHDGDFWPVGQNHIINFLCAVMVPTRGGRTGFLDTRKAYLSLSAEERRTLEGAYTCVHAGDIEDFKTATASEKTLENVTHSVLQTNPLTKEISLYLPASSSGIQAADGARIGCSEEFIRSIEEDPSQGVFEFEWTQGDLLIWDNTTTMHRSMGGYLDEARLLYRCQARLLNL
jgi:alpha-ketoglutarate-dependent taurine dioxygenase